jgi:hypothetical protein
MIMYNPDIPEQKKAVQDCVRLMVEDAIAMEGTVSVSRYHRRETYLWLVSNLNFKGEHGIGLGKKVCGLSW